MKACFISPPSMIPKEIFQEPWGVTGQWCWVKAFGSSRLRIAELLDPKLVSRQWDVLNEYDLIFVPGFISMLQWMRELWKHRPGGTVISWLDYGSDVVWRMPAVQYDPMLPAEIGQADVVICPDPAHKVYFLETRAKVVEMVHPVDGEALKGLVVDHSSVNDDCIWVFHSWAPDLWALVVPYLKDQPNYRHIAVGLSNETFQRAGMYFDIATTILPRKDFFKRLSPASLCVDMSPFPSMGRVILEAASLGVPVLANKKPFCNVDTPFWYDGLFVERPAEQIHQVQQHWIEPSKAMLEQAFK